MPLFDLLYSDCEGQVNLRAIAKGMPPESVFFALTGESGKIRQWIEDRKDKNIYFGVATRSGGGGKEHIIHIPAVWCDIDFKNTSEDEAKKALNRFPFEPIAIVHSGNGLHVYFGLREPAEKEDIEKVEDVLRRIAGALGGDFACAEVAHILRVPGTFNVKDPANPKPVKVIKESPDFNFYRNLSDFDVLPEITVQPTREKHSQAFQGSLRAVFRCKFMSHCREQAATLSEPLWKAMVSQLVRQKGGPRLIHELSRPYPGYSKKETDAKILTTLDGAAGAFTCQTIFDLGFKCEAAGECDCRRPEDFIRIVRDWGEPAETAEGLDEAENSASSANSADSANSAGLSTTSAIAQQGTQQELSERKGRERFQGNLTKEIRDWIDRSPRSFSTADIDREFALSTRTDKNNRSRVLSDLLAQNRITREGNRKGYYRAIRTDLVPMDLSDVNPDESFDCHLPLGLNSLVNIYPSNLIVIAGIPNSGKTTLLLNIAKANLELTEKKIHYFNSEMGPQEMRNRLEAFKYLNIHGQEVHTSVDWWLRDTRFFAYERSGLWEDVIQPDDINLIDYLEIHDEFYKISQYLFAIYEKLRKGIAIVAIQKNPGQDAGLGGARGLEKARLYLAVDYYQQSHRMKIVKAKNYVSRNPNGMIRKFEIYHGSVLNPLSGWEYPPKKKVEEY